MNTSLQDEFDRAVSGDPGIDPATMAAGAITEGGRLRRRRRWTAVAGTAAGLVTVLGAVAGLTLLTGEPAKPTVTVAAAMLPRAAPGMPRTTASTLSPPSSASPPRW